ncbi:unnamed protein product [Vitrella brassicaformis CCMP3155]|uniref:Hexosyltransferase n=1 Tax=Vitrella brassicaformis (strain CCMP3155) TaxID=1169540 RepID=A0A0G4EJH9_VITBC|nr:unnamed protein product [Vitrella brassicaformis CCMP3155]|eukprot:CEL97143.1 unnamed protein product [Vitrella brassicaformis CCMP3155]
MARAQGRTATDQACGDRRAHIALGVDDAGLQPIPTLLNSLHVNHRDTAVTGCVDVHLVTMDVPSHHPTIIVLEDEAVSRRRWPSLQLHLINFTQLEGAFLTFRSNRVGAAMRRNDVSTGEAPITSATNIRILLPALLPLSVAKVLYLDYDVIVNGSLEPLFVMPLGPDEAIAAKPRHVESTEGSVDKWLETGGLKDKIMWKGGSKTFNPGVLLMSLPALRCSNASSTIGGWNRQWGFDDQTALNFFFNGSFRELPMEYNVFVGSEDLEAINGKLKDDPSWRPVILHYKGGVKPWSGPNSWTNFVKSRTRRHKYAWLRRACWRSASDGPPLETYDDGCQYLKPSMRSSLVKTWWDLWGTYKYVEQ